MFGARARARGGNNNAPNSSDQNNNNNNASPDANMAVGVPPPSVFFGGPGFGGGNDGSIIPPAYPPPQDYYTGQQAPPPPLGGTTFGPPVVQGIPINNYGDNNDNPPNQPPRWWNQNGQQQQQNNPALVSDIDLQQREREAEEQQHHQEMITIQEAAAAASAANPSYRGEPLPYFRVVVRSHWLIFFFFFAGLAIMIPGLIGILDPRSTIKEPDRYILVGIGGFLVLLFGMIFAPKIVVLVRPNGADFIHVQVWTLGLPPLAFGYASMKTRGLNCPYNIHSWITTSTDKHGRTHTHHHSAVAMDGVGIYDGDADDFEEFSQALGRPPGREHGEPQESLCLWCQCCCGCY